MKIKASFYIFYGHNIYNQIKKIMIHFVFIMHWLVVKSSTKSLVIFVMISQKNNDLTDQSSLYKCLDLIGHIFNSLFCQFHCIWSFQKTTLHWEFFNENQTDFYLSKCFYYTKLKIIWIHISMYLFEYWFNQRNLFYFSLSWLFILSNS